MFIDISMTYLPGTLANDDHDDVDISPAQVRIDTGNMLWFQHSVSRICLLSRNSTGAVSS